ncbi:hypothetical protein HWV62_19943 [Athelia sp. TMB]|nr:hypothetical protein HWV62_19943 [Athelia sp. TMB]
MAAFGDEGKGQCVMRGSCGKKGWIGAPLPCPYDGPPLDPEDQEARDLLVSVCGDSFAEGPVCCTSEQLETLNTNLKQAEPIISSCPACRNNFRQFFCSFTCSPNQANFLEVTSTQELPTGATAVQSVNFHVAKDFGEAFYGSCENVQIPAANDFAMTFIGGGAKNYTEFFKFLGDEKPLGSPFQIDFPLETTPGKSTIELTPRNCADNDLASRCTCIDCPSICPALPPVLPPSDNAQCNVGLISCFSFILILAYALAVVAFLAGYVLQVTLRKRRERTYERMVLSADSASVMSPRSRQHALVGAGSLSQTDGGESLRAQSESRHILGRGASLLDSADTAQPRQYRLNTILRRTFYRLGLTAASYPWLMLAAIFTLIGLLNIGWTKFQIETDPVRLWVSPDSESKLQKEYFDQNFGPFYRPEQIFVTVPVVNGEASPVLSWDHLKYWLEVENDIRSLQSSPNGYKLDDVCFKPAGPRGACVFQSVLAWFGNDLDNYDEESWREHLSNCASHPGDCLPDFQQPLSPHYVLGGVPVTESGKKHYVDAAAMVVTIVVSDSLDEAEQAKAMEWERTLRAYLVELSEQAPNEAGLALAFSTGVSLEEEINKSTNTDVTIVVLSYLAMFFYVSLTLGQGSPSREEDGVVASLSRWGRNFPGLFKRSRLSSSNISVDSREVPHWLPRLPRGLFVGSKFTLGLFGIGLVILSVSSSVGFFSACGVKVTLIIAEVIPFLVLAVGVDNVFILVHELDRQNLLHGPNASAAAQGPPYTAPMSPNQGQRSPFESSNDESIDGGSVPLYLSAEERVARALAKMGPSILLSTITETIAFALGALVPMPAVRNFALYAAGSVLLNAILQVTVFVSALLIDLKRLESNRVDCFPCIRLQPRIALLDEPPTGTGLGRIARFIRRYYAPFLLQPLVKGVVLLTFAGIFVASLISMQHIELGLDQRLALPSESYLIPYFNDMNSYLDVGPPVYFVTHDVNVTGRAGQRELCGRFTTCDDYSVANILEAERKRPESSFISEPSASWIDDFMKWLDPAIESCCRVRKLDPSVFCGPRDRESRCEPCLLNQQPPWNITMRGIPEGDEFMRYLQQWLISPTNEECPVAGAASFGAALSLSGDKDIVVASHFRTFHSPLKTQADFINSFAAAHRIAADISERTGASVFPYSLHYVFFDQYAHIVGITQEVLGVGLAAVLVITALMLGSWRTGSIVTAVVGLTVTTVMGVMAVWGISLNAISLVNLVISLGIAVEFCAHVARAFMSAGSGLPVDHPAGQKERDERMWTALVDVGPSIYYFRMWFSLIISGALHGLVLLPVVLSLAGGTGFPQQEADEEWMSNAIRNDYEYAPFLADDDSITSD